jgi:hypothetical protein
MKGYITVSRGCSTVVICVLPVLFLVFYFLNKSLLCEKGLFTGGTLIRWNCIRSVHPMEASKNILVIDWNAPNTWPSIFRNEIFIKLPDSGSETVLKVLEQKIPSVASETPL